MLIDIENTLVVTSGRRKWEGQDRGRIKRYKGLCMNKLQGYIVQHRDYSQYFIIAINGI